MIVENVGVNRRNTREFDSCIYCIYIVCMWHCQLIIYRYIIVKQLSSNSHIVLRAKERKFTTTVVSVFYTRLCAQNTNKQYLFLFYSIVVLRGTVLYKIYYVCTSYFDDFLVKSIYYTSLPYAYLEYSYSINGKCAQDELYKYNNTIIK